MSGWGERGLGWEGDQEEVAMGQGSQSLRLISPPVQALSLSPLLFLWRAGTAHRCRCEVSWVFRLGCLPRFYGSVCTRRCLSTKKNINLRDRFSRMERGDQNDSLPPNIGPAPSFFFDFLFSSQIGENTSFMGRGWGDRRPIDGMSTAVSVPRTSCNHAWGQVCSRGGGGGDGLTLRRAISHRQ